MHYGAVRSMSQKSINTLLKLFLNTLEPVDQSLIYKKRENWECLSHIKIYWEHCTCCYKQNQEAHHSVKTSIFLNCNYNSKIKHSSKILKELHFNTRIFFKITIDFTLLISYSWVCHNSLVPPQPPPPAPPFQSNPPNYKTKTSSRDQWSSLVLRVDSVTTFINSTGRNYCFNQAFISMTFKF